MLKNLCASVVLLLPAIVPAQGNFPFPTANTEWVGRSVYGSVESDDIYYVWKYWVDGDTLVNDTAYTKVYKQHLCYSHAYPSQPFQAAPTPNAALVGGIREDSNRVYFRRFPFAIYSNGSYGLVGTFPANKDVILYDFTLEAGDTILYSSLNETFLVKSTAFTADGRKKIVLELLTGLPFETTWTEGFGSRGLFETTLFFNYLGNCVSINGQSACPLPCTPLDPLVEAADIPSAALAVSVTPSPATSSVHIRLNDDKTFQAEVYTLEGRRLAHWPVCQIGEEISVEGLPAGLLLFRVIAADGSSGWAKVVKQ